MAGTGAAAAGDSSSSAAGGSAQSQQGGAGSASWSSSSSTAGGSGVAAGGEANAAAAALFWANYQQDEVDAYLYGMVGEVWREYDIDGSGALSMQETALMLRAVAASGAGAAVTAECDAGQSKEIRGAFSWNTEEVCLSMTGDSALVSRAKKPVPDAKPIASIAVGYGSV